MENQPGMPSEQPPVPPVPPVEKPTVVIVSTPQVPGMQSMPFGASGAVPPQAPLPDSHGSRGWVKALISFVCLLIVLGGAYYAYAYVYNSPGRVLGAWQSKGISAAAGQYHVNANVSISATINKALGTLSVTTSSDVDAKDPSSALSKSTIGYSANYGGLQFSASGIQALEIGKVIYVNLSSISAITSELDPKYNGWIKIDENELAQYEATSGNSAGASALTNASTSPDIQKLQQLLTSADVVSGYKTDGREVVDGSETYHYSLTIDKGKLKSVIDQALGLYSLSADNQMSVNSFIDGATVSKSDVWIGIYDHQLHKVDIQLKLPVPAALAELAGDVDADPAVNGSVDDLQRIADAKEIATANELYYNDNNGYPATLASLLGTHPQPSPGKLSPYTSSSYLSTIPTAPATSGPCTAAENTYTYTPSGTPYRGQDGKTMVYPSYVVAFCINQAADGYPAGQIEETSTGITSVTSNDFAARPTPAPVPTPTPSAANTITLEVAADTSALAKPPVVTAPASADDVLGELQSEAAQGRDFNRLSQVEDMQGSLSLYFEDKGGYPDTLVTLTPNYLPSVPVAPTPADGTCTDEQNTYWYRPGGTPKTEKGVKIYPSYLLGYCLGAASEGTSAGYHDASSSDDIGSNNMGE